MNSTTLNPSILLQETIDIFENTIDYIIPFIFGLGIILFTIAIFFFVTNQFNTKKKSKNIFEIIEAFLLKFHTKEELENEIIKLQIPKEVKDHDKTN